MIEPGKNGHRSGSVAKGRCEAARFAKNGRLLVRWILTTTNGREPALRPTLPAAVPVGSAILSSPATLLSPLLSPTSKSSRIVEMGEAGGTRTTRRKETPKTWLCSGGACSFSWLHS